MLRLLLPHISTHSTSEPSRAAHPDAMVNRSGVARAWLAATPDGANENSRPGSAVTISHCTVHSTPTPTAAPFTAAIVGMGSWVNVHGGSDAHAARHAMPGDPADEGLR